ncbi:hypothetical protein PVIIG_05205 [Plasmodium vivax India VII]|uniref:PIR Superfamily Protein n=1 Tax=Plasmodium vivax India VII TaxID=1077284 RepID=A0A0J9S5E3_PLAVI|nr:hypothetical protein PVIIG_05205 [Plasmodium vivax India VII]
MSHDNLNISQLRDNYPFLNNIWDLYDSFDKPVVGGSKEIYDLICKLATDSLHNDKTEYYNICMKILRNLDLNGGNQVEGVTHSIRCNHVNNWLYNSKDKINLSNKNIMDRIFDLSGTLTKGNKRYECLYYSYDENYEDPINIIRLRIFDDNMEIIKNTLMRKGQQNYNFCQKYMNHKIHYQQLKLIILVVLHLKFQQQLVQWLEYLPYSHYYIRLIQNFI